MEGERILRTLKSGSLPDEVIQDVKNYLGPVLGHHAPKQIPARTSQPPNSKFGKYELFSLKLLKLCIEQCQRAQNLDISILLKVGMLTVDSLGMCGNASGKAPPLSFEKLLYHFASQCFNCKEYVSGAKVCKVLYDQIGQQGNSPELSGEACSLLKYSFNLLWKVAAKLEQHQAEFGPVESGTTNPATVNFVLQLRQLAFLCLLSSGCDFALLLDRILKADQRFRKVAISACSTDPTHKGLDELHVFHASLMEHPRVSSLFTISVPCGSFTPAMEYLLHVTRLCISAGHSKEGKEHLERVQSLCEQHEKLCRNKAHMSCIFIAQATRLFATLHGMGACVSDHPCCLSSDHELELLEKIAAEFPKLRKAVLPASLPRVTDTVESLLSILEERREEFQRKTTSCSSEIGCCFIPRSAFPPLQVIVTGYVRCIEAQLQAQLNAEGASEAAGMDKSYARNLELSARSQQLACLSFLAQVLLDLVLAEDESECLDDIEVMRSSIPRYNLPASPPPPHPKKAVAEMCLPVLQCSRDIIQKSPEGLPLEEHRWLGNNAFNLGLALFRRELYVEAVPVLELACQELGMWCSEAKSEEEWVKRSEATQLLKKFTLLFNSSQEASLYSKSLECVVFSIATLSTSQLTQAACASVLTGLWIRGKKSVTCSEQQEASAGGWGTMADVLNKRLPPLLPDAVAMYLEEELKLCKAQSDSATEDQFAVAKQLLDLYSESFSDAKVVDRARLMVEVAIIGRTHKDSEGYTSPLPLLDDALAILEPLTNLPLRHSPPSFLSRVHEQLAVTQLWKAICIQEELVNLCLTAKTSSSEGADGCSASDGDTQEDTSLCLNQFEEGKMMNEDGEQCLYNAVQCWGDMWMVIRDNRKEANFSDCVNCVTETFQNLYLTSSLCRAHRKLVLSLKTLGFLIEIYQIEPSPETQPIYHRALALYSELVLFLRDRDRHEDLAKQLTAPTEATGDVSSVKGRAVQELQASQLYCQLSLAEYRLSTGQFDSCRELLVTVFEHPLLQKHSTLAYSVAARGKLITSRYLQHRQFSIKPTEEFLQYLLGGKSASMEDTSFRLTDLEFAADAMKIYRNIAALHAVQSQTSVTTSISPSENTERCATESMDYGPETLDEAFVGNSEGSEHFNDSDMSPELQSVKTKETDVLPSNSAESSRDPPQGLSISSSLTAWDTLNRLLQSLETVARIHLVQGAVREAYYFAREGLALTKLLLLHTWYVNFVLLLCEIQHTRGERKSARVLLLQAGRLLEIADNLVHSPHTSASVQESPGATAECAAAASSLSSTNVSCDSSDEHLTECMLGLSITSDCTESARLQPKTLPAHPSACLCSSCTSPDHVLQVPTLLWLYGVLSRDEASSGVQRHVFKTLSAAVHYVSDGAKKCDKVLDSCQSPLLNTAKAQKSGARKKKAAGKMQLPGLKLTESAAYKSLTAKLLLEQARCYLQLDEVSQSLPLCQEAVSSLLGLDAHSSAPEISHALVELYYVMGVAVVRQMEKNEPDIAAKLWENQFSKVPPMKPIAATSSSAADKTGGMKERASTTTSADAKHGKRGLLRNKQTSVRKATTDSKGSKAKPRANATGRENEPNACNSCKGRQRVSQRSCAVRQIGDSEARQRRGGPARSSTARVTSQQSSVNPITVPDFSEGEDQVERELVVRRGRPRRRAVILDSSDSEDDSRLDNDKDSKSTRGIGKRAPSTSVECKEQTGQNSKPNRRARQSVESSAKNTTAARRGGRARTAMSGIEEMRKGSTRKSTTEATVRPADESSSVSLAAHTSPVDTGCSSIASVSLRDVMLTIPPSIFRALAHFLSSFQFSYPTAPSILLRETCHWLCVMLSPFLPWLSSHFFILGTQPTLSHQAVYSMGKKLKASLSHTTGQSLSQDTLSTLSHCSDHLPVLDSLSPVTKARNVLRPPSLVPPPLCYTRTLIHQLPKNWTLCNIAVAPSTTREGVTSTPAPKHLLLLQTRPGKDPFLVKIPNQDNCSGLQEFEEILAASDESMKLREKRAWWNARGKLNQQLQELLSRLESSWLGHWKCLLTGLVEEEGRSTSVSELTMQLCEELRRYDVTVDERCLEVLVECGDGRIEVGELQSVVQEVSCGKLAQAQCEQIAIFVTTKYAENASQTTNPSYSPVLLILGRSVQGLPWESLPSVATRQQAVTRMPSLQFTFAHKLLTGHSGRTAIDPRNTFYVVNPRNDLPKTEKVFAKWFSSERGWKGVVGRAPTEKEYRSALEEHELFVYCGHGTGREYLNLDGFRQVRCQATTLLVGCSSGRLSVAGSCDPRGMALYYLTAGCPALVANLWDVTDADIDRFCQALLKSWLHASPSSPSTPLPCHVTTSRAVCKLRQLIGASPIIYGVPVLVKETHQHH